MPNRDEQGSASIAQTVITAPVLLFTIMLIVQFGLMFHARNIAEQAAQEGLASARTFNGSAAQGRAEATALLASVGTSTLKNRDVQVARGAETARVTITGTVLSLVPGVHLSVSESAEGPVERYVPPTEVP